MTEQQAQQPPYGVDEVAALRRAGDWPMPTASRSQLIEHGFDQARRFYLARVGCPDEGQREARARELHQEHLYALREPWGPNLTRVRWEELEGPEREFFLEWAGTLGAVAASPDEGQRMWGALKAIAGPEDRGYWIEEHYRPAGGGYQGLQAIARAALPDRQPSMPEPEQQAQQLTPADADHVLDALGEVYAQDAPDGWNEPAKAAYLAGVEKLSAIRARGRPRSSGHPSTAYIVDPTGLDED